MSVFASKVSTLVASVFITVVGPSALAGYQDYDFNPLKLQNSGLVEGLAVSDQKIALKSIFNELNSLMTKQTKLIANFISETGGSWNSPAYEGFRGLDQYSFVATSDGVGVAGPGRTEIESRMFLAGKGHWETSEALVELLASDNPAIRKIARDGIVDFLLAHEVSVARAVQELEKNRSHSPDAPVTRSVQTLPMFETFVEILNHYSYGGWNRDELAHYSLDVLAAVSTRAKTPSLRRSIQKGIEQSNVHNLGLNRREALFPGERARYERFVEISEGRFHPASCPAAFGRR